MLVGKKATQLQDYLLAGQLSSDPELMTLMRLLTKNTNRRPVPRLVVNLCRRIGVLGKTETLHQDAAKAKKDAAKRTEE